MANFIFPNGLNPFGSHQEPPPLMDTQEESIGIHWGSTAAVATLAVATIACLACIFRRYMGEGPMPPIDPARVGQPLDPLPPIDPTRVEQPSDPLSVYSAGYIKAIEEIPPTIASLPISSSSPVTQRRIIVPDSGIDEAYLTQALDKGCQAAFNLVVNLNQYGGPADLSITVFNEEGTFDLERKKKIKELRSLVSQSDFLRHVPEAQKISIYRMFCTCLDNHKEREMHLFRLYDQFSDFQRVFHDCSKAIKEKVSIGISDTTQEAAKCCLFSVIKEHYDEILTYKKLLMSYVEELSIAVEQSLESLELRLYAWMFIKDPTADFSSILTKGYLETLQDYKKRHPLSDPEFLEALRKKQDSLRKLKEFLSVVKVIDDNIYHKSQEDFIRLHHLMQRGFIEDKMLEGSAEKTLVFNVPTFASCEARASATIVDGSHLSEGDAEAGSVVFSTLPAARASISGTDFCRMLQEVMPERSFTVDVARNAYVNALHYTESLYTLLAQPTSPGRSAQSVAHLQMDVGFAAFHALEQLLTAMMLEKAKSQAVSAGAGKGGHGAARKATRDESENLSLFKQVGHSLMARLLAAKIALPEGVRELLRDSEEMEFAIRDLPGRSAIPSLLQNTQALLCREAGTEFLFEEESKSRAYGLRVLQAINSILSVRSSDRSGSKVDLTPYYDAVRSFIPAFAPIASCERAGLEMPIKVSGAGSSEPRFRASSVELSTTVLGALERSQNHQGKSRRKLALEHNLNRLQYLMSCLEVDSNFPLFPYYVNQARFVLCTITEEFLYAAHESKHGALEEVALAHNLRDLVERLGLKLSKLSREQQNFITGFSSLRNQARYGYKVKGHSLPAAASASSDTLSRIESASGSEEGFEMALGGSYSLMISKLRGECATVDSLCREVAARSFKSS